VGPHTPPGLALGFRLRPDDNCAPLLPLVVADPVRAACVLLHGHGAHDDACGEYESSFASLLDCYDECGRPLSADERWRPLSANERARPFSIDELATRPLFDGRECPCVRASPPLIDSIVCELQARRRSHSSVSASVYSVSSARHSTSDTSAGRGLGLGLGLGLPAVPARAHIRTHIAANGRLSVPGDRPGSGADIRRQKRTSGWANEEEQLALSGPQWPSCECLSYMCKHTLQAETPERAQADRVRRVAFLV
jgi:hypothetical protein